jgi:drug/metabolite transporter (DMT)-like permease
MYFVNKNKANLSKEE